MTAAERAFQEIAENLRLWNLKHDRKEKPAAKPEIQNAVPLRRVSRITEAA